MLETNEQNFKFSFLLIRVACLLAVNLKFNVGTSCTKITIVLVSDYNFDFKVFDENLTKFSRVSGLFTENIP